MHRIPHNSRVRRRLFSAGDPADQASNDNFTNILQESLTRDRIENSRKWNFDFENDVPLDGIYEWYPSTDKFDWIGIKSDKDCDSSEESFLPMKLENEVTPRTRDEEAIPISRKRKRSAETVTDKAVRRKITFE